MLRETMLWLKLAIQGTASAAVFVLCLYFAGLLPAFLLLGITLLFFLSDLVFLLLRQRRLRRLSDDIGQVMRGAEQISFREYEEGELSILNTEIRKMTVMLREQNAQLRNERQFLKESLEDMSHQLRTPLTSMMLIVERMRRLPKDGTERMKALHELTMLLTRMQWLIETLLTLSRVEAGAVTFRKEPVSCRQLIQAALDPISVALELKGIEVQLHLTEEPAFTGDMQFCTEALGNLLKNCMEHTPEGGCIRISAEQTALYTGITVTDSGEGISQTDLPHLFERFYRGSEFSKTGYGIGLAFAKRVITEQGGSLQARNAEPHGAEFEIRFFP